MAWRHSVESKAEAIPLLRNKSPQLSHPWAESPSKPGTWTASNSLTLEDGLHGAGILNRTVRSFRFHLLELDHCMINEQSNAPMTRIDQGFFVSTILELSACGHGKIPCLSRTNYQQTANSKTESQQTTDRTLHRMEISWPQQGNKR